MKLMKKFKRLWASVAAAGILGAPASFANFHSAPANSPMKTAAGGPDSWRLGEPVRYKNMTVFPILSKTNADATGFETLDEALASGDVLVTEHGSEILRRSRSDNPPPYQERSYGASVNQLVLINRGKRPVLLLAGEVVSGGNQDRIVGKDRIVPAGGEPLPLDVFCVEHGRWTGPTTKFAAGNLMVHPSVREKAAVDADQSGVWDAVRVGSTASASAMVEVEPSAPGSSPPAAPAPQLSANSISRVIANGAPTQSYQKIYQSPAIREPVETFAREIEGRFADATAGMKGEGVIGVVVAYGGEVAWSDAFASPGLFRQYWPKLVRSYAVEALARPALIEKASLDDARGFLER
ncbi:MAG: DUF6569 family protein, partial [Candidatus Acidiferrales bacterium]